jgi:hypothetical protein
MRGHLLYPAVLAAGVMTAGAGLMVALGYLEQPGPFNEAILGAIGGGMTGAGFRRWRKCRSPGLGHTGGTRQRATSAINDQRRETQTGRGQGVE